MTITKDFLKNTAIIGLLVTIILMSLERIFR